MGKKKDLEVLATEAKERYEQGKNITKMLEKLIIRCREADEKKGKTKREPRPLTDYQKFYQRIYPTVRAQNPTLESADLMKIIASMWKVEKANGGIGAEPAARGRSRAGSRAGSREPSQERSGAKASKGAAAKAPAAKAPAAAKAAKAPAKGKAAKVAKGGAAVGEDDYASW